MPKTTIKYSAENLENALKEIKNGLSIRHIAKKYGIPKSTLHFKIKNPEHKNTFGPSPILTIEEENCLEKWIIDLSKKGFPLKKEDLQLSVEKFLTENPRQNPFKDNFPGEGWVRGFLKRHPCIGQRTSEGVTFSSACVSEYDIRKWFLEIHRYFDENNLLHVLDDPKRVFNGDESGFQLCPNTGKVLAQKGVRNVYSVETSSPKENMTVMFTFSAAGQSCPPLVVYNYQRIPQKIVENIPSDWGVGRSENGWMTSEIFFEYIANVFHPYLIKEGIPLPVVYFLDGHKTHLTYKVSKLCTKLGIELVALYPNATRILQPADVAVFRPVKAAWKESTREWLSQNPGQAITKVNFTQVLNVALQKSIKAQTLINGFKACGLHPFDPNAVDYTKCLPNDKETNPSHTSVSDNMDKSITFSIFLSLIGPNKLIELQNVKDVEQIDENLKILHKVYKYFDSTKNLIATTSLPKNEQSTSQNVILFPTGAQNLSSAILQENKDLNILPVQTNDPIKIDDTIKNDDVHAIATLQCLKPIGKKAKINIIENVLLQYGQDHTTRDVYNAELEKKELSTEINYDLCPFTGFLIESQKTPAKNINIEQHNTQAVSSEISPAYKIRNSDLGSYLTLPKTPERKGKRDVQRMPFAITSAKYKAMFKEKVEKKELEFRKKEQKKREREEAKSNKESCKKQKTAEKITYKKKPKNETNECKMCKKTTKTQNKVVCDMCSSIFHIKCVPLKHKIHVPEDIHIDLFICHVCYIEDSKSDSEDETNEDQNDDIESEGSSDANHLFTEYIRSKKENNY